MKRLAFFILMLGLLVLSACKPAQMLENQATEIPAQVTPAAILVSTEIPSLTETSEPPLVEEIEILSIPLPENLTAGRAEISGMAWYGDRLVLLPQYPDRFKSGGFGSLFYIEKSDIMNFIGNPGDEPLSVVSIEFDDAGISSMISGFEGFEAIAFNGETFFVTVETRTGTGMLGYVYRGVVRNNLTSMKIEADVFQKIQPQADFSNASEEAILIYEDQVYSFYEDYGKDKNFDPVVHVFDLSLQSVGTIPMVHLEYRLTDVTEVDVQGRFWGINYFFPGDVHLLPDVDPIAEEFGKGLTHALFDPVERLVQFQITPEGIVLIEDAPLQFRLLEDDEARNWEGLVAIDNLGFLLVTDKFPFTILGFCEFLR